MCSYSDEKKVVHLSRALNSVKSGHTVVVSIFCSLSLVLPFSVTSHLD